MQQGDNINIQTTQVITATATYTKFLGQANGLRRALSYQGQGDAELKIALSQDDADNDRGFILPAKVWVIYDQFFPANELFIKSLGDDQNFAFSVNDSNE